MKGREALLKTMFDIQKNELIENMYDAILLFLYLLKKKYNYRVIIEAEKSIWWNFLQMTFVFEEAIIYSLYEGRCTHKDDLNEFNRTIVDIRDIDVKINNED